MNNTVIDFTHCKRIAIVGYSRNRHKFGNAAYAELKKHGYEVFAIHPTEKEIAGVQCYPSLTALQGHIDGVLISVPPLQTISVLQEAASIGLTRIWIQQGAESDEVVEVARRLGLDIVTKKCVLMYAPPVRSIHNWHRAFTKLIGKL